MTMMYRGRFNVCNSYTTQVRNVDNERGYACEGQGIHGNSVGSAQFCSEAIMLF